MTSAARRSIVSSLAPFVVASLGALAMALAFPKTNAVALAPIGAAGLFWAWFGVSPKRAFWVGWLAGSIYFAVNFAWFGETAGALIAPYGFALALGPALADGLLGFALCGPLVAFAATALAKRSRLARAAVPAAAAAAFAAFEWWRSEGVGPLGVPFASLGYTQVATPLAPLAAFAGTYGITFALGLLGAAAAYAVRLRQVRGAGVDAAGYAVAVAACASLAYALWPARTFAAPTVPVAAVQGNIPQAFKFTPAAFVEALGRYETLTERAAAGHPALVIWPETVIPAALNRLPDVRARFAALARRTHTELVVGSLETVAGGEYNVLYAFAPDGTLDAVYRKRQLVPFAEHLPYAAYLAWIPWTTNISHFLEGSDDAMFHAGDLRIGPVICWESAFTSFAARDASDGADALAVATDDAWFGTTAGPYMHAQIAQMRALETGRWIVRAASTGISGIVAPDGRYTERSPLGVETVVAGRIGRASGAPFTRVGAAPIALGFALVYAGALALGRRP